MPDFFCLLLYDGQQREVSGRRNQQEKESLLVTELAFLIKGSHGIRQE